MCINFTHAASISKWGEKILNSSVCTPHEVKCIPHTRLGGENFEYSCMYPHEVVCIPHSSLKATCSVQPAALIKLVHIRLTAALCVHQFHPISKLVNMQFRLTNSQRYLVNVKPGTNHSINPTNPNGKSKR